MVTPGVIKIDSHDPDIMCIREVASACKEGKVVVFPTETVYGIGGKMSAPGIEKRLREIKGRSDTKPFSYHIGDWGMLDALKVKKTPLVCTMARQFWPGPVTLVVLDLAGRKIGIRFPRNRIALALIQEVGEPFIATSANGSGKPSPHTAHHVIEELHGAFDQLIDGGKTELMLDSTVVDLTGNIPVILRKGAQGADVEKAVERIISGKCPRKRILIVCTGNSCRSPMAEGWLKHEIEKKGLSAEIEIISCGTSARDGLPCTLEAELVLRNREIDLSGFHSRRCRKGDLWSSDLVLAMSTQHAEAMADMLPSVKEKMITLNVEDPIGMSMQVYEKTLLDIESKMKQYMNQILHLGQP
jgi:tRNA threonylcarbamoyl adenosine modification protein (Sua5/YciO/YrdC/YwlC family)